MAQFEFNVPAFRLMFPPFSDMGLYTDEYIISKWDIAECFIDMRGCFCGCTTGRCREKIAYYMVAHLVTLDDRLAGRAGAPGSGANGNVTSATVDKVSVSVQPPPIEDSWDWWLNQTPYGALLLAMLSTLSVGVLYVGGSPERSAFRKVGGRF